MPDHPSRREDISAAVVELHGGIIERWSPATRKRFGLLIALIAALITTAGSLALFPGALPRVDLVPYVGLAAACWVGAGGVLVPVPGIRPLSWVMIVHQSVSLDPLVVAVAGALAMALGQTSLYIAAQHGARHHRTHEGRHHHPRKPPALPDEASDTDQGDGPASRAGRVKRATIRVKATGRRAAAGLKRHPVGSVLLLSVVPSPLTSMASGAAGAASMPFARFFLASLAGFFVFVCLLVVLGAGLLALFGISADGG
jgi:membrane protein DedA with SNARE-associated domain